MATIESGGTTLPRCCLACGELYDAPPGTAQLCPRRYLSEHSEEWKKLVVEQLQKMGAIGPDRKPTKQEHNEAILWAQSIVDAESKGLKPMTYRKDINTPKC